MGGGGNGKSGAERGGVRMGRKRWGGGEVGKRERWGLGWGERDGGGGGKRDRWGLGWGERDGGEGRMEKWGRERDGG